jgi:hypothetical protein
MDGSSRLNGRSEQANKPKPCRWWWKTTNEQRTEPKDSFWNEDTVIHRQNKIKVKLSRYLHAGAEGERLYSCYSFFTSALDGVSGQRYAPAALYPQQRTPGTLGIRGLVGLRAGLDTEARRKVLCLCRGSNPGHPVCSLTLYWLAFSYI